MYSNYSVEISSNASSATIDKLKVEKNGSSSWYVAMAKAWGSALDKEAGKIVKLSNTLENGIDTPALAIQLSAQSHKLSFLSNAASTASNSAGQALETLAKKQ